MQIQNKIAFLLIAFLTPMLLIFSGTKSLASQVLAIDSGPLELTGSIVDDEVELSGYKIYEKTIPFKVTGQLGVNSFEGTITTRVLRSKVELSYYFYYQIKSNNPDSNSNMVSAFTVHGFDRDTGGLKVDWRPDLDGAINPMSASRTRRPNSLLTFKFDTINGPFLNGKQDTRFFYIGTTARKFDENGFAEIKLLSGDSTLVAVPQPIWPNRADRF